MRTVPRPSAPSAASSTCGRGPRRCRHRIGSGAGRRADATDLRWLEARFAERDRIYEGLATAVVDVDDHTPDEVVELILAALAVRRA